MEPGQSSSFSDIYASLRGDANLGTLDDETLADIAMQQSGLKSSGTSSKKSDANDQNQQYMAMYNQIYPGQVGPPQGT
jgi:hypothetical protein